MITSLNANQLFVFGSNLAGRHEGGSAKQARDEFGAEDGIAQGITGQCYAFPTLDINFAQRTREALEWSVREFYRVARENPDKEFLLTKVGCGIAGYDESFMRSLFVNLPANVVLPDDWQSLP